MSTPQPLFDAAARSRTLAWHRGQPITAGQFITHATALAQRLPAGRPVNLCTDRYLFALGFVAGLMRGQMSLLPPNAMPQTLRLLTQPLSGDPSPLPRDAAPYALTDGAKQDTAGLPTLVLSHGDLPSASAASSAAPAFDASLWAACLLTSGSTGTPQPQRRRWGALQQSIDAEGRALSALLGWASLDGLNLVATVPAQHSYGFESSVLLALLGGAAFDSGRPFYPADIAAALERLPRPRALVTTPVHLKTLLAAGLALPPTDLVLSATAPLLPHTAQQAEAAFGARTLEIYGCTEVGQVAARRTTAGDVWQALGALRLHAEAGPDGERYIVSDGHAPQTTPLADRLELIDAQRFRLLGRANDLIHVAGKRSSLSHLNFHLNRIEGVLDGAFWLPDDVPEAVVRPLAFVVAPGLTARQITDALRREVESAFVPRRIVHVERLPREATGKLTAQRLREFALHTLARLGADATPTKANEPLPALEVEQPIDANLPAFDGHFPGAPVLPGAMLLALVLRALAQQPAWAQRAAAAPSIRQVKFLAAVGPGDMLRIRFEPTPAALSFSVHRGTTVVARGALDPTPATP